MADLKFLIVEDSPVVRLAIRSGLIQVKVSPDAIWEAETSDQAIERFDEVHPDVVFLDINLPVVRPAGTNPSSFLDFLTANPEDSVPAVRHMLAVNPKLKVVVCTGNPPTDPRVRELIMGGAFHFIQKPVHLGKIHEVVEALRKEST